MGNKEASALGLRKQILRPRYLMRSRQMFRAPFPQIYYTNHGSESIGKFNVYYFLKTCPKFIELSQPVFEKDPFVHNPRIQRNQVPSVRSEKAVLGCLYVQVEHRNKVVLHPGHLDQWLRGYRPQFRRVHFIHPWFCKSNIDRSLIANYDLSHHRHSIIPCRV